MPISPLLRLTGADLIVRTGYQMGKTPVLPIYAATLGATDWFLGVIVSVSTITGMVLKPTVGLLSDRWGRRWWLLSGTAFFVVMPFLYRFVHTPRPALVSAPPPRVGHGDLRPGHFGHGRRMGA